MLVPDDRPRSGIIDPSRYSTEGIRNLFGSMAQRIPGVGRPGSERMIGSQPQFLEAPPMQRLMSSPPTSMKEVFVAAPPPIDATPNYGKMFPTAFTFICFVAFGPPVVSALVLAQDPTVRYFVGRGGYAVLLVPVLLIICHLLHLRIGRPRRVIILVSTIAPCVLFIIVGNVHAVVANDLSSRLYSTDCTTFDVKREIDKEWLAANETYQNCLGGTTPLLGISRDDSKELFRIHHCSEYPSNFTEHRDAWTYLRQMEETQACSGWCTVGPRLWTYNNVHDSCSVAAATILDFKIHRIAVRMITYTAIALVVILVVLLFMGPYLRKSGIEF